MALKECPTCGRILHHLGYSRHRMMHYEQREREAAKTAAKTPNPKEKH